MGILAGEIDFHGVLDHLDQMPQQKQFISTPAMNAAYVGGVGSGKTISLCTSIILNSANDPNGFSLCGRLNMPALESSTMKTFLELVPESYGTWHPTKKMFRFLNGHELIFKHLDMADPKISGHIKSMNLSAAYVDEGTEIAEEIYLLLLSRLRRKTAPRHLLRLSSNPAGHDWVWRRFFDPDRSEKLLPNVGITASTLDNPFLSQDYVDNMLNQYPEDWAQRFIYGNFSDFSDLIYKEFGEATHVWDSSREHNIFGGNNLPPLSWPVIVGIDIGSDIDPWAICTIAVSPDGRLFQYGEVYGNSLLIATIADQLHRLLDGRRLYGIAYDYSNRQCALELAEYNINGQPAIKEVEPGLFKCAQYMHIDPRLEHPFSVRVKGSPYYFVASHCKQTIGGITNYKWAKDRSGNPTGEPSHEHSHAPDGVRYAIHTFRPLPAKLVAKKLWETKDLDPASREFWRHQDQMEERMKGYVPKKRQPQTMQAWQREAGDSGKRFQRPHYAMYKRW